MFIPGDDGQGLQHGKTQVIQITLLHKAFGVCHEGLGDVSGSHRRRVCGGRKEGAVQKLQRRIIVGEQVGEVEPDRVDKLVVGVQVGEEVRLEMLLQAQVGRNLQQKRRGRHHRLGGRRRPRAVLKRRQQRVGVEGEAARPGQHRHAVPAGDFGPLHGAEVVQGFEHPGPVRKLLGF